MGKLPLKQVADDIWTTSERIAHALRNTALAELSRVQMATVNDKLSGKQNHMVIAIRSLCEDHPKGVSLKLLASHLGVTPASASVMVETLTNNGYLVRDVSKRDRRAVRIRLSEASKTFYDSADQAIQAKLCSLADTLGPDFLHQWRELLQQAERELVPIELNGDA